MPIERNNKNSIDKKGKQREKFLKKRLARFIELPCGSTVIPEDASLEEILVWAIDNNESHWDSLNEIMQELKPI